MTGSHAPKNAVKHGIASKKHRTVTQQAFLERFSGYISAGNADPKQLSIMDSIAEIQAALTSVRREKALASSAIIVSDATDLESSEGATALTRLLTLDDYERKLLSRRRRLGFASLMSAKPA